MRDLVKYTDAQPLSKGSLGYNYKYTFEPSPRPTSPTLLPTLEPTATPTLEPTTTPTIEPTVVPTLEDAEGAGDGGRRLEGSTPTATPTLLPTDVPTLEPSKLPTSTPTARLDRVFQELDLETNLEYGSQGEQRASAWDYDSLTACICDSSWPVGLGSGETQQSEWFGPDCSLRRCPTGDDPMTPYKNETDGYAVTAEGGRGIGRDGNLVHVDCSNQGICNHLTGTSQKQHINSPYFYWLLTAHTLISRELSSYFIDKKTGVCKCFAGWSSPNCGTAIIVGRSRLSDF